MEIPINKDCTITSKCGINLSRGKIDIKAGKTTKVKYEYDKLSGALIPCIVDEVTNTYWFIILSYPILGFFYVFI